MAYLFGIGASNRVRLYPAHARSIVKAESDTPSLLDLSPEKHEAQLVYPIQPKVHAALSRTDRYLAGLYYIQGT